jgi:hypothetical protein
MKLEERLKQIEKRIADLKLKADSIKDQLPKSNPIAQAQSLMASNPSNIQAPPVRRGRKKAE